jgi:hypothetical protein
MPHFSDSTSSFMSKQRARERENFRKEKETSARYHGR